MFGVVLISDKGAGVEVLLGPAFGTGGGPMIDVGVWVGRVGLAGVCCRLICSSSISALASAIAKFERAILRVVNRELCELRISVCDFD